MKFTTRPPMPMPIPIRTPNRTVELRTEPPNREPNRRTPNRRTFEPGRLVRVPRLELGAFRLGGGCSIHLSYTRV
jgi:hypothetical protein